MKLIVVKLRKWVFVYLEPWWLELLFNVFMGWLGGYGFALAFLDHDWYWLIPGIIGLLYFFYLVVTGIYLIRTKEEV